MATNGRNGRKRSRRWILFGSVVAVLLILIVGLAAALRPNRQIDPSKLAIAEKGDTVRSVVATGKIEPLTKVEVKSKAGGIVEKIQVDYGDRVKMGQLLVGLDKEQLEANVRESRANREAAKAAQQATEAAYERGLRPQEGGRGRYWQDPFGAAGAHRGGVV